MEERNGYWSCSEGVTLQSLIESSPPAPALVFVLRVIWLTTYCYYEVSAGLFGPGSGTIGACVRSIPCLFFFILYLGIVYFRT